jgi:hypothetical protein
MTEAQRFYAETKRVVTFCMLTFAISGLPLMTQGCGHSLPADTLTRFANTLESLKYAYHALCDGREDNVECVRIREVVNASIDQYTALNDSVKEQP